MITEIDERNMDKFKKINTALNIASSVSSALSLVQPAFLAVPVVAGVINEIWGWHDAKSIENRLYQLEKSLQERDIEIDTLRNKIAALEEHNQYVLRNSIRHLCVSAVPETTDTLIDCIIDFIMNDNQQEMDEIVIEILCDCNAIDIELMNMIKKYKVEHSESNQDKVWHVTWQDFLLHCLKIKGQVDATTLIVSHIVKDDGSENYKYAYFVRSLMKMQRLGVVNINIVNTLGGISQNNIESFSLTLFGEQMLEHIR